MSFRADFSQNEGGHIHRKRSLRKCIEIRSKECFIVSNGTNIKAWWYSFATIEDSRTTGSTSLHTYTTCDLAVELASASDLCVGHPSGTWPHQRQAWLLKSTSWFGQFTTLKIRTKTLQPCLNRWICRNVEPTSKAENTNPKYQHRSC